jgi:hypothetical protein
VTNFAKFQTAKHLKRTKRLLFSTNAENLYKVFLKLFGIFEIVMMLVTIISPMWTTPARKKKQQNISEFSLCL